MQSVVHNFSISFAASWRHSFPLGGEMPEGEGQFQLGRRGPWACFNSFPSVLFLLLLLLPMGR